MTPEQLEKSITKKTKIVVLNSPSNPTGLFILNELKELANILLKYTDIYIVTDDIYEHIRLDEQPFNNIVMVEPKLKDR